MTYDLILFVQIHRNFSFPFPHVEDQESHIGSAGPSTSVMQLQLKHGGGEMAGRGITECKRFPYNTASRAVCFRDIGWVKNKLQYTIKSQHKRYFHNDYLSLSGDFENHIESQILQKKVQSAAQSHSFHRLARLCSTSFKLGFNSMWTETFQMCKLGLEKAGEPEIKLPTSIRS